MAQLKPTLACLGVQRFGDKDFGLRVCGGQWGLVDVENEGYTDRHPGK